MIKLPDGFIAIRYPGYFWHPESNQLYSIKVSGILTPLDRVYKLLENIKIDK